MGKRAAASNAYPNKQLRTAAKSKAAPKASQGMMNSFFGHGGLKSVEGSSDNCSAIVPCMASGGSDTTPVYVVDDDDDPSASVVTPVNSQSEREIPVKEEADDNKPSSSLE